MFVPHDSHEFNKRRMSAFNFHTQRISYESSMNYSTHIQGNQMKHQVRHFETNTKFGNEFYLNLDLSFISEE